MKPFLIEPGGSTSWRLAAVTTSWSWGSSQASLSSARLSWILRVGRLIFYGPNIYFVVLVIGNIGRYLNHSCDPNLVMVPVRSDCLVPHLALFTSRMVEAGQELCYDYGAGDHGDDSVATGTDRTNCLCKSHCCRNYLPLNADFIWSQFIIHTHLYFTLYPYWIIGRI